MAVRRAQAEDVVFGRQGHFLDGPANVLRHLPVVGRTAAGVVDRLHRRSVDSDWVAPKGIGGWEGPLDPEISWAAKNGPAGKRETWGPMLSWGAPLLGNRKQNHWAAGGCLEKLDRISGAKSQRYQSKHRRRSGVSVAKMVLGFWDAFNAGHCNQEAMREGALKDPKVRVTRDVLPTARHRSPLFGMRILCGTPGEVLGEPVGNCLPKVEVTFTPTDVKLLLMLVMEDLVTDDPTQLQYLYEGFRNMGKKQKTATYDPKFDPEEPYPHTVIENVCKKWGQEEQRSIIGDKKPGKMLDNRVFDGGRVQHLAQPPADFDRALVPSGGAIKFFAVEFDCKAQPEDDVELKAWVHTADNGQQTSGWIHPKANLLEPIVAAGKLIGVLNKTPSKDNVDFFWVPQYKEGIFERPWTGFAQKCNPDVDMFQVWTIHQDSLENDWPRVAAAPEHRDAVEAHLKIAESKQLYVAPLRERFEEAKTLVDAELASAARSAELLSEKAGSVSQVERVLSAPLPETPGLERASSARSV